MHAHTKYFLNSNKYDTDKVSDVKCKRQTTSIILTTWYTRVLYTVSGNFSGSSIFLRKLLFRTSKMGVSEGTLETWVTWGFFVIVYDMRNEIQSELCWQISDRKK